MLCFLCLIVNSSRAGSVSDPSLCLVVPAPHEVRGGCRHLLTGTGRWGNRDKRLFLPLRSLPCNEAVKRRRGIVADCCTEPVLWGHEDQGGPPRGIMLNQQHEEHLGAPTDGPEPDAEGWECSTDLWPFRRLAHRERVWRVRQSGDATRRIDGARSGLLMQRLRVALQHLTFGSCSWQTELFPSLLNTFYFIKKASIHIKIVTDNSYLPRI